MTQAPVAGVHSRGVSLRTRFLLAVLLIFLVGATASYVVINRFSEDIVRTLSSWFAEKSVP